MIETHPSPLYLLIFLPGLLLWAFQTPLRLVGALAVLGLLSLRRFFPGVLKPRPLTFFLGALLAFLGAYFLIYAKSAESYIMIYSLRQFQALSLSLLAMIVLQWFSWRSPRFDWLLFSMGLFFLFATVSPQWEERHRAIYVWFVFVLISAVLILLLLQQDLQKKRDEHVRRHYFQQILLVYVCFWGVALSVIQLAEWVDQRFSEQFSRFLLRQQASWSGFSGSTQLNGNTEVQLSDQVALTLDSPRPLEYLRGAVLTLYENGRWLPLEYISAPLHWEGPWPQSPGQELSGYQAVLPGAGVAPRRNGFWAQVRLRRHYQGIIFTPPELKLAALPRPAPVFHNQYALLRQERSSLEMDYWLWLEPGVEPEALLNAEILKENRTIAPQLRRALRPLAEAVTRGARSPLEKARRLEQWFHTHFKYSLQVGRLTPGQDPTVDFVLNRRPAYCSWFASGMVLMLRSLDIPAHLVSGWRGMSYQPLSRVWVVREKQAHDWVEVLDESRQVWVSFDPTPAAQLNALLAKKDFFGWIQEQLDGLRIFSETWQERIRRWPLQEQLLQGRELALGLLRNPFFYGGLGILLLLNLGWRNWRSRRLRQPLPLLYEGAHPRLEAMQQRLFQRLQQEGLALQDHWTLSEIGTHWRALRAESETAGLEQILARWGALRFGQEAYSLQELSELEQQLEDWMKALNGRSADSERPQRAGQQD